MTWLLQLRARIRALFRRDIIASEIREELDFHVQMRAEEYAKRGATEHEARRHARRRFGNLALIQDRGYDVRGGGVMETVLQDIRYGVRLLIAQRGFSLVAILTLALGIGLSTALVSVIDAAILRPLPYPHPEQLVSVLVDMPQGNGKSYRLGPSLSDMRAIAAGGRTFSDIAMWRVTSPDDQPITAGPEPERLDTILVTEGYFKLHGVQPLIGRDIVASDTLVGAPAVAVLDYRYWKSHHAGSRDAIGKAIESDRGPITIIGVMPASFHQDDAQIWRPLVATPAILASYGTGASIYARMRPGLSLEAAQREMTEFLSRMPGNHSGERAALTSLHGDLLASSAAMVKVLSGAVLAILFIACVNVAGLLIARGATRVPELAVRASIGAGRARLVRQLLTESVVLATVGGGLGILLAWWSLDMLVANIPMSLDVHPTLNPRVLTLSTGLALVTGLVFGIAPALRLSRVNMSHALARGSRRTGSVFSRRSGQLLIGVEIALAVVLLAGASLMLRSFTRILSVDLGFDPDSYMTLEVQTVQPAARTINHYYPALLESIRAIPGVSAAGAIDHLPLAGTYTVTSARVEKNEVDVTVAQVLPGFFEAFGYTLTKGRFPTEADRAAGRHPVVVNEQAWQQLFRDASFAPELAFKMSKRTAEIVGIVKDVRSRSPLRAATPEVYEILPPNEAEPPRTLTVVVRPAPGARVTHEQLRKAAYGVGPPVFIYRVRNGGDWVGERIVTARRRTVLLTLLGGLGLILALVGVFGMTAYAVTRRTREIGVRIAFGARPADVVRTMVRDAAIPVVLGLAAGIGGAVWATKLIATFLYQTTPTDPAAFAAAAIALGVAACVAAWIPARRAARVDPIAALRSE